MLAEVAVLLPVPGTYTYLVPDGWSLAPGARVWVPFRGRSAEAVVLSVSDAAADSVPHALKKIARRLDAPPLSDELLQLARWIAGYYLAPPGDALRPLLPPGGRAAEARRVALTDEGTRAAAGLGQALDPLSVTGLGLRERTVLLRLHAEGGAMPTPALASAVEGARAAVETLEARGLVTQATQVSARRERQELLLRAARPVADDAFDAEPVLKNARRRQAVYRRIRDAGELSLSSLRAAHPGAAPALAALRDAGLVAAREVPIVDDPFADSPAAPDTPPALNPDQRRALDALAPAIAAGGYAPFLLHGVTGSGKTEVYLHAISVALDAGKGALALVPEISLTPQLASRFRARFGGEVAVLHSALTDRERFSAWARLADGRVRIALGARSAVFAPIARLGVIIVDEEHDPSFKQEEGVRYHGRDVALRRARFAGCACVLGSATPSVEIYEAAKGGRMGLLTLPSRATPRPLPTVEIIDLRRHKTDDAYLSAPLHAALARTLAAGEQAILFLNRRGFATFLLCRSCGHRFSCPDCSVTLTWHRAADRLACHYCGHLEPVPADCPRCQSSAVERLGLGTEKIAALVAERYPGARVARLDRDTAQGGRGVTAVLDAVRAGEVDVLVGTQMITKGHDFPGVTLVGVVLADQSMGFPDFRAAERTFQLLEQVAGRAGRGQSPGRVVIQTYSPTHPAVARAQDHDYARFFTDERAARRELDYPPFTRLAALRIDAPDAAAVEETALRLAAGGRAAAERLPPETPVRLLGPSEAPIGRLKGRARWQLLVKSADPAALRAVVRAALATPIPAAVRVIVDIDPVSML